MYICTACTCTLYLCNVWGGVEAILRKGDARVIREGPTIADVYIDT